MGKSKWFDDVFLPSLFERYGTSKGWLSEKQFMCFERQNGVKTRQLTRQNSINDGFYVFGAVLEYTWNGRIISVFPRKSGKAEIYFGRTKEEDAQFLIEEEKRQYKKSMESAQKMKEKRPEEFEKRLEKAAQDLLICIRCLDASAASENDDELEDAIFDLEEAEKRYYKYYFA